MFADLMLNAVIDKARSLAVASDWEFVSSAGATLTAGIPFTKFGIGMGGGRFWVKKDSETAPIELAYGGGVASAGLSAIPVPANFSFSIPQMPSKGRIYKLPRVKDQLSLTDPRGEFVMLEKTWDTGLGVSEALAFIGGEFLGGLLTGVIGLIPSSKVCVYFTGQAVTVAPINSGVSICRGIIH